MNLINRKPMSIVLVVLLTLSLAFVGCKRSATPDLPEMPEEDIVAESVGDEGDAILDLAEQHTEQPEGEVEDVEEPPVAEEETEEPPVVEDPTEAPPEPTPEITTPEPTEAPPDPAPEVDPPAPTEEVTVTSGPQTHIVQAGENLFRIALRYGKTVEQLARVNGITNPARIHVGQKITIPGTANGEGETPPPSGDGVTTHVVQPGENLFRIALRYNYDYFYLARYNSISNPATIYPGQVIKIPQN